MGRRFQVVGANPVASTVMGLQGQPHSDRRLRRGRHPLRHGGRPVSGLPQGARRDRWAPPYLLGPIAAVVIGGASLTGGLASPVSTFAAAFFLAGLNQMMRVLSLPTALQFVVFGLVIVGGMLVSGDGSSRGSRGFSATARNPPAGRREPGRKR